MNYDTKCMGVFYLQYNTGSNPVLTTKNKIKDMKKIYWFFWWLYNCPEIVWLKIKSYFKN